MRLLRHLWALACHHSGARPKVTQEQMASLQLYGTSRRNIKAETQKKEHR